MKNFARRAVRMIRSFSPKHDLPTVAQPVHETARVIFTAFGRDRLKNHGKVSPDAFFPPFSRVLAEQGVSTCFAHTLGEMRLLAKGRCVVVHIYNEVQDAERLSKLKIDLPPGAITFNDPKMGRVIAHKLLSNKFLTARGIPMPETVSKAEGQIFSNEVQASGAAANLVAPDTPLDPMRYNTRFIDTRVAFEGKEYFTTVRLMCVGPTILHAFVRARPASEETPSVHAKDTPLDPKLIEGLQAKLVTPHRQEFESLAKRLSVALGPGFYSYDLLIEQQTGNISLAEPGYKFNDMSYVRHLRSLAQDLPSHRIMFSEEFARLSAHAFLSECQTLGLDMIGSRRN